MAYNEQLADRIRQILSSLPEIREKKMFGGLSFLLHRNVVCGVLDDVLVARIDPNDSEALPKNSHVKHMDFTGRPMKGFLYVDIKGVSTDNELKIWVDRCLQFVSNLPPKK